MNATTTTLAIPDIDDPSNTNGARHHRPGRTVHGSTDRRGRGSRRTHQRGDHQLDPRHPAQELIGDRQRSAPAGGLRRVDWLRILYSGRPQHRNAGDQWPRNPRPFGRSRAAGHPRAMFVRGTAHSRSSRQNAAPKIATNQPAASPPCTMPTSATPSSPSCSQSATRAVRGVPVLSGVTPARLPQKRPAAFRFYPARLVGRLPTVRREEGAGSRVVA